MALRFKRAPVVPAPPPDEQNVTTFVVQRYDRMLLALTFVLMGVGVVMVYSASVVSAEMRFGDGTYYLKRQLFYLSAALIALVVGLNLHHDIWRKLAKPLLGFSLVMLAVVLLPGVAAVAKGASRWIDLGPVRFQPSEALKLSWIVFLAWFLSKNQERIHLLKQSWGIPALFMAVIAALLMKQPDFGSTLICGGVMFLMIWAAGSRWLHVGGLVALAGVLLPIAVLIEPYRVKRFLAFLSPDDDPQGVAYHINQALISFGSGKWTGLGLGGSRQKLLYLPEAHTDFIFSILGEELGLVGVGVVMVVFALFVWRGFRVARFASSSFGALLAFGITAEIGFQAVVNMGVATALLPTKGLTLPFVSYGGSSLITLGAAAGMLLNISRRSPPPGWLHHIPEPGTWRALLRRSPEPQATRRSRGGAS